MLWPAAKLTTIAGVLAFGIGSASAAVINLTNGGTVETGAPVTLPAGGAAWGFDSTVALNPATDYADFMIDTNGRYTIGTQKNIVTPPPGLIYEVGTAAGNGSLSGGFIAAGTATILALRPGVDYFVSLSSTSGGSGSIGVAPVSSTSLPGALVLFGSVLAGAGAFVRRKPANA